MMSSSVAGGRPPVRADGGPERRRQMAAELRQAVEVEEQAAARKGLDIWLRRQRREHARDGRISQYTARGVAGAAVRLQATMGPRRGGATG